MAKFVLEILDGDRAGEVVDLGDRPLRIGRKPQNDLVLADEKASGVHAEVALEGDRYVLRDLGSTNGTLMDGRKVTEVVLGGGDIFSIGRVRVRFRGEGDSAAATGEPGMAVERIDAARLQAARSSSRSTGLLAGVLVLAIGAGGYLFWRSRRTEGDGAVATGPKAELRVSGNRLPQETANCESETGWDPRVGGAGFRAAGAANTGTGAFVAERGDGDGGDFAVAATTVDVTVLAGRTLMAGAHLRTEGDGRVGVRLCFWSSLDGVPFRFCTGTPLLARSGWEHIEVAAPVPVGADRCRVEIAAVLPAAGSTAAFDDVSLVESGQGTAVEHKVGDTATVIGTGESLAVRSMDPEEPATVLHLLPATVPPAFAGLQKADLLAPADLGVAVAFDTDERSASFRLTGADAFELWFPAESAGGLLASADQGFVGVDASSTFTAKDVLLGTRSTRCMVSLVEPQQFVGRMQGATFRLVVPAAAFRLTVGFRPEWSAARELLRKAEAAAQEGHPGEALDRIRELLHTAPHDAATLAQALARRAEWHEGMAARLRQLESDLDDAAFFDTRGGFERVVSGIDELLATYGEQNVDDPQAVAAMRARAASRLAELDAARDKDQQQRREKLAAAFEQAGLPELAALVRKE